MRLLEKLLLIAVLPIIFWSCTETITDNLIGNNAPDTFIFLKPDSTISQQSSRLSVHWWGDDPDGLVVGYLYKWDGLDNSWHFTTKNDSVFNLPIGTIDTGFVFKIASVDNAGNGIYDTELLWNGINIGPEPFIDQDGNGSYTAGEKFTDLGNIDPTPSELKFPIKNSAPEIKWSQLSTLPERSFPVITVAWDVEDLDGLQTVTEILLAVNDTAKAVSLAGNVRLVTLRANNFDSDNALADILVDGSESKIADAKLSGLKLNSENIIYVQAKDIAGAKSGFIRLPDTSSSWYVAKPKGKLLLVDDFFSSDAPNDKKVTDFYNSAFSSLSGGALNGKYDVLDLNKSKLPYQNITFYQTLKLFKYVYWFAGSRPSFDLASLTTNPFLAGGGKIAFSFTFEDASEVFPFGLNDLQLFLPVDSLGQKKSLSFLFPGAVAKAETGKDYPQLTTASTIGSARTFYPNQDAAEKIYSVTSTQLNGNIGLMNKEHSLFFIGLPLHQCNGGQANVNTLLQKIFFQDFGLTL